MKSKSLLTGIAFCLLIFTNCTEKTAEGGTADSQATVAKSPADIVGYWVNAAWWDALKSTKSPRQAAAKLSGISSAIIRQDRENWLADLGFNWHEGLQYTLREKDGSLQLYDAQNAAVQAVAVAPQADGSVRLDSTAMVRLAAGFDGAKVVGHEVLGGQYDMNGKTVVFNPNGTVVGIEGFNYYELMLDYVVDELGADRLSLSQNGAQPQVFAFKFENGHLLISAIEDVGGSEEFIYKIGKTVYDLKKK